MDDSASRRDDGEVIEGSGSPFKELKSFIISLELDFFIFFPGVFDSCLINLNAVIDDEIDGAEGVDFGGISSESGYCISHGSEVDNCGYSCEILEDDSGGFEGDLDRFAGELFPTEDFFNVFGSDFELIAVSNGTFK